MTARNDSEEEGQGVSEGGKGKGKGKKGEVEDNSLLNLGCRCCCELLIDAMPCPVLSCPQSFSFCGRPLVGGLRFVEFPCVARAFEDQTSR